MAHTESVASSRELANDKSSKHSHVKAATLLSSALGRAGSRLCLDIALVTLSTSRLGGECRLSPVQVPSAKDCPGPIPTRPSKTWPVGMGHTGRKLLSGSLHCLGLAPPGQHLYPRVPSRALIRWEARSAVVGPWKKERERVKVRSQKEKLVPPNKVP